MQSTTTVTSKHEKVAINRMKIEGLEKERALTTVMEKMKKENEENKKKLQIANDNIKTMTKKIMESRDKNEAQRQLDKQRSRIDYLERQLIALQEEETDNNLIQRAFIDEDLEESVAKRLIQRLDCSSCQDGFNFGLGQKESAAC